MDKTIIEIKNISKKYKITRQERYLALRDKITNCLKKPIDFLKGKKKVFSAKTEDFLALKDVSFDVKQGEVIGIIGRNGAGKTTLLKILSRITYPSKGEVILHGRIASLLEVGTGFHPELTGRENIYFNGSILGMKKREIDKQFNEIVKFAGDEKFIDTPVKRYSSGMQVRLAFAVAAHLKPEILLIDEVLSVGDIEFQKKCLGKMDNVAKEEGKTILFVSHNMGVVRRLCTRAILLDKGKVVEEGSVNSVINRYMSFGLNRSGERIWTDRPKAPGDDVVRLRAVRLLDKTHNIKDEFSIHESISLEIEYDVLKTNYSLNTMCYFVDEMGMNKFVSIDNLDSPWKDTVRPRGLHRSICHVPGNFLNEGVIRIHVLVITSPYNLHARELDALVFKVVDDMDSEGVRGNYSREWPSAVVRPKLNWDVDCIKDINDGDITEND